MQRRGVNYDVGRVLQGNLMRPTFDPRVIQSELEIIKRDLHCSSVKIQGLSIERLTAAAEFALQQDLEVWLAPELFEKSRLETLDYIVEAAAACETLRARWPSQVVLSIGTELTLFMHGIIEGDTFMDRISRPDMWRQMVAGTHNPLLNDFLRQANEAVRRIFHGPVTYASLHFEAVDWSIFDFVCVDYYRDVHNRNNYGEQLKQLGFFDHHRPVVIGEFGCCTYRGAEQMGAMGWDIVDWAKSPPQLRREYVYDQGVQARELADQLGVLDTIGVDGAFVFTFVQPAIELTDPALMQLVRSLTIDLDFASYSLVKSFTDQYGATYPDLPWEPKEAFNAVAGYYGQIAGHRG